MSEQWWALFRPGRPDPEAADYDKSDLISLALRRSGLARGVGEAGWTRDAAWKRLRRRGWKIELLPELFWEQSWVAWERQARANAEAYQRLERSKERPLDLLRELAEDRHRAVSTIEDGEVVDSGHHGTLHTCSDRLCDAAATLLGRG